jgi:hypothetical protein
MIGVALSLPLAAVYSNNSPPWAKLVTNPRKLKSAHIDYLMQAFAAGFVYGLEWALQTALPLYIVLPLLYGAFGNPTILLLESTSLYRSGLAAVLHRLLKATSPVLLLFAWLAIAVSMLPTYMLVFLCCVVVIGLLVIWQHRRLVVAKVE